MMAKLIEPGFSWGTPGGSCNSSGLIPTGHCNSDGGTPGAAVFDIRPFW